MKSVCIDTNIIIRHLVDADPYLLEIIKSGRDIIIPIPIWLETVFVLEKVYEVPRTLIVQNLFEILSDSSIRCERELLETMLQTYLIKEALSIVDCFVLQYCTINKHELKTYDKKLTLMVKV